MKSLVLSMRQQFYDFQPSLFITIIMTDPNPNSNPNQTRKLVRHGCKYTATELEQIQPFKLSYVKAENVHQRAMLLHEKILPIMTNYWFENGWNPTKEQIETTRKAKVRYEFNV
jgi:hypothetical protein